MESPTDEPTEQPTRRRWLTFRLRTLMVVTLVVGVLLIPVVKRLQYAHLQRRIVLDVVHQGGRVAYHPPPPSMRWLRWLSKPLGRDFQSNVMVISFSHSDGKLDDVTFLQGLKGVHTLDLDHTRVSDLAPLADMNELQTLWLEATDVADLSPVANMRNLERLRIKHTRVTDLTPLTGLPRLSYLDIEGTSIEDLAPLSGLPSLRRLHGVSATNLAPLRTVSSLSYLDVEDPNALAPEIARLREHLPRLRTNQ